MDGKLYRYEDIQYAGPTDECGEPTGEKGPLEVRLLEFTITKHTKCGAWIDGWKFVNLQATKRYACPTLQEALESFIARKTSQCRILAARLKRAKTALSAARELEQKQSRVAA